MLQRHQHIYEQIQERNHWFATAGVISAYWCYVPFLETKDGYLVVHVNSEGDFNWEYIDYGWEAKKKY